MQFQKKEKRQTTVRFDSHHVRLRTGEVQRKTGSYMYRWTDKLGKRNTIYAATLEDLREQEEQILVDQHDGIKAIERRFGDFEDGTLVDVYIDITGYKETAKRPEMLRLMRDCADGKVNLIFAETKGYLSANTREFCYWLHFIFNLKERVDIITDDDQFNINTILNADKQREALIKMAEDYIYLNPPDHQKWLNGVVSAITNLREDG